MIKEEIGQGYKYTFLNGLRIYNKNGQLLAEEKYHCCKYWGISTFLKMVMPLLLRVAQDEAEMHNMHLYLPEVQAQFEEELTTPYVNNQRLCA